MKYFISVAIIFALMLVFVMPLSADDITKGPIKKLGRGVANVAGSPLEFINGMRDAKAESGILASFTWGILQGTVNVLKRAVVGVYEVATFPIPFPKDYRPILNDPEFILDTRKVTRLK